MVYFFFFLRLLSRPCNDRQWHAQTPLKSPHPGANDATQHTRRTPPSHYTTHPQDPTQPTVYGLTMVGWKIPASLQIHDSYLLNHTHAHTHANRCPISCSCNEPSPHLAAGHKRLSCP